MRVNWLSGFVLFCSVLASNAEELVIEQLPPSSPPRFQRTETFCTSHKHVIISSLVGGISHVKTALEIGKILHERGHKLTYITNDDQTHLSKPYGFPTISVGPTPENLAEISDSLTQAMIGKFDFRLFARMKIEIFDATYQRDYLRYREIFQDNMTKPDFVICDMFAEACFDAAWMAGIPFAALLSRPGYSDIHVPYINNMFFTDQLTTESMTIWDRIQTIVLKPMKSMYYMYPALRALNKQRAALGVPAAWGGNTARWGDSIKIVNTFFGFDLPRPVSPLVQMIGPVMSDSYPDLTPDLASFFDTHERVVYVAFGQHMKPTPRDFTNILLGLINNILDGTIDGVIWATVITKSDSFIEVASSLLNDNSPTSLTALRLINDDSVFKFVKWAPQFAVLNHHHTVLFISHGGAESSHEALYTGTPMLIHPFFADQPSNAARLVRAGVAIRVNRADTSEIDVATKIRTIIKDTHGTFRDSLNRMRAVAQINSRRVGLGADAIEEAMFSLVNGTKLPHRYMLDREIPWRKRTNHDLHALAFVGIIAILCGIWKVLKHALGIMFAKKGLQIGAVKERK